MARVETEATGCGEEGQRAGCLGEAEALQLISRELQSWGYTMTRLPKHFTLETCLRIVGAE